MTTPEPLLDLSEDRFARFRAIEWWDQDRLARARILVIGAGALGNEIIKNLALLGVGSIAIVDRERIETSNLTRSVLFRPGDAGAPKAECAARAAREIYPATSAVAIVGDVVADVGLGWFRWADVVLGALDNREARVIVNSACARTGRPWIDGGIEVFQGVVRGFAPPATACYECTMTRRDWELLNQRRSCSFVTKRASLERGTPTTPSVASVIAGMQTMEAVKILHGLEALLGRGYFFDGMAHNSYPVQYPVNPECPWHERPAVPIEACEQFSSRTRMGDVMDWASARLGGVEALDLAREIVESLECAACGEKETIFRPLEGIDAERAPCPQCRGERTPQFLHSIPRDCPILDRTAADLGLPPRDILWARNAEHTVGIELTGDSLHPDA